MVAAAPNPNDSATDNAPRPPTNLIVTNPATGEVLRELPVHDAAHVQAEMARARAAQSAWAALPIEARCARMAKVADVIVRRADEIAGIVSRENGKVRGEVQLAEIATTLNVLRYFTARAPKILAPERIELALLKHRRSFISYQPRGVVGVITPWNYPFFMPGSDVAMALIAGNAVVLKPSEITPLSSVVLKECYDEAGIDPDLFRLVTGFGETGAALIDAMPDHVVFTGSVPTGRRIAVACAERFISYTLELGGKAPAIVLPDADLERTANAIVWGGFSNAGQICASVERVYATDDIYEGLVERVAAGTGALRVGDPSGPEPVDVGAMTFPRQREIVESLVADARAKGARVMCGGQIPQEQGLFYSPTVLADCTHEMDVMNAEIFGPVVPMMKVASEDEAIRLANDSHLGLGAYVFTADGARGRRVAEQLRVGSVMINDVLLHAGIAEMPWGGIKQSGLGVVRSDRGLRELCEARHINEERLPANLARDPFWFPYSAKIDERVASTTKQIFGSGLIGRLTRLLFR